MGRLARRGGEARDGGSGGGARGRARTRPLASTVSGRRSPTATARARAARYHAWIAIAPTTCAWSGLRSWPDWLFPWSSRFSSGVLVRSRAFFSFAAMDANATADSDTAEPRRIELVAAYSGGGAPAIAGEGGRSLLC